MRSSVLYRVFVLSIITGVFSSSSAFAQSVAEPRTWTATPFLNVSFGTNAPGGSPGIGAGVGYDFTANLGVEGEVGHQFDVAGDNHDIDWSVSTFSANVLYHFDVVHVTPYATAGFGMERSSVDVKNPDPLVLVQPSSNEVVWNFGGGAKYKLNDRMLVRADLRRFEATDLAPDFWRVYGGLTFWIRR
jgi:opacity protein-like surface antigen